MQRKLFLAIIFVLVFLALFYVHYDFAKKNPGGADSVPRWLGTEGWLYEGINPYDAVIGERAQMVIVGHPATGNQDKQLFVYPFYVILYYLPVIWLPFTMARALWMILLELSVVGVVVFSSKAFDWSPPPWLMGASIGISILLYNSIRMIFLWQLAGLVAFLIILAVWALKEKRDILAGLALALATIKPQMIFLIIPLLMLWALRKRVRFLVSFIISMVVLAGLSFIAVPTWLGDMLRQIREYPNYTSIPTALYIFTGSLPAPFGKIVEWILLLIVIAWLLWEWKLVILNEQGYEFAIALTLLATNIIAPRAGTTNYLMMLPAFFFVFAVMEKKHTQTSYLWVFLLQLAYLVGVWVLFALTISGGAETWPMYFPMPLLLLGGLLWVRFTDQKRFAAPVPI